MAQKKYHAYDLTDFIQVEVTIECSNCQKVDGYLGEGGEDYLFDKGWRATKNNVYCPECAKKKLKL